MSLPSNLALHSVMHLHTLSVDLAANLLTEPASLDGPSSWHSMHLPAFAAARRQSSHLSFSTTSSQPSSRRQPVAPTGAHPAFLESASHVSARKRAARQSAARLALRRHSRNEPPTSPVSSSGGVGSSAAMELCSGGTVSSDASSCTSSSSSSDKRRAHAMPSFSSASSQSATQQRVATWKAAPSAVQSAQRSARPSLAVAATGAQSHGCEDEAQRASSLSGTLRKRTRLTRRLVQRHFVLHGDTLYNFRDVRSTPTWRLPLAGATVGTDLRRKSITVWDAGDRCLQLVARDDVQLGDWAVALSEAAAAAGARDAPAPSARR